MLASYMNDVSGSNCSMSNHVNVPEKAAEYAQELVIHMENPD